MSGRFSSDRTQVPHRNASRVDENMRKQNLNSHPSAEHTIMANERNRSRTLINFTDRDEPEWLAINDGVMGGRSTGGPELREGKLHFSGTLSLANNGGFSSIRAKGQNYDLRDAKALAVRARGDGRTYQIRLYTDARYQGSRIAYAGSFTTTRDEWREFTVAFDTLRPVFRGRNLDGPPIDLSRVEQVGFLIADRREGNFSLTVDWIKAM